MFLRVAIVLQTAALFAAPITAGLMLSWPNGHVLHSASSYAVFVVALLHLGTAVLVWRPGGGSPRPILYAAGFLALTLTQVALGLAHLTALHVPMGALLFGLSLLQLDRVLAVRRAGGAPGGTGREDAGRGVSARSPR
ncbi:hypothetical protein [Streptosporangium longisporum]|uniref:Uncharacterized protein n=1 Tax=Streptosporangium longisporum TaxID=46187 RepID=A0ABP6KQZ9_9ACTN